MMYSRGQKIDYDDWAALGNKDWSWEALLPYMLKHEYFDGSGSGFSHNEKYHGDSGKIHTSFPSHRLEFENSSLEACHTVFGSAHAAPEDAGSGDHTGVYTGLCMIDQSSTKGTRSYATTGYLMPILKRPNLKVLTESHVTQLLLDYNVGEVKVTGVEFMAGGEKHHVNISREVILSAGSIGSPQILELSGIGDPKD